MNIQITGKHIEVTDALKDLINKKAHVLAKRFPTLSQINAILHVENKTHIAEATVHAQGFEIHARAEGDDMYKSIELLMEKLLVQITKHKEKLIEQHQQS